MSQRAFFACFILLTSAGFAVAGTSANLLGVDYNEWLTSPTQIATDTSGALYLLGSYALTSEMEGSSVTKLSADGTTIVWQDMLGFLASSMAVSPSGDVFVVPEIQPSDTALYVSKLGANGSGVAWTAPAGFVPLFLQSFLPVLAADSQGRTYLAAPSATTGSGFAMTVVRINAAGSAVDFTANATGTPTAIAADGSGAVVVAGIVDSGAGFVTRLASDGSTGYYTALSQEPYLAALALDASGNAVVLGQASPGQGLLLRLDSTGAITVSTNVVGAGSLSTFGLDSAGNAYVLGLIAQLYPVQNSIATCLPSALPLGTSPVVGGGTTALGTAPLLTVVAPDGSIPQITYVPDAAVNGIVGLLAVGPNSTVFVATSPAPGFVPTQLSPFPQGPPYTNTILLQLSPQSAAQTVSLACVGNAATYFIWPVAPGEVVALIGSGLGPVQGVQTEATPQSPFPVQVSGVQVTFDGTPAPLLWVQGSQINAVAPWSLTPGTNTKICVSSGSTPGNTPGITPGGVNANCLTWPVTQTAPGVFTVDGVHAAALNQDGSINSAANPAAPGSIVSVYATGLGPINPPQADGSIVGFPLPSNVLQTGVEALESEVSPPFGIAFSSVPVQATYAGPAPYLVAGTTQVNFQVSNTEFYLAPGGLNSLNVPSSTASQIFEVYVAGQ